MSFEFLEEKCLRSLQARVQTLPEFANSCMLVLDDDDLFAKLGNAPRPWCGVAYEGLISNNASIAPSHKVGLSTDMQFSLMFSIDALLPGQETGVIPAVRQLAKVRRHLLDTKGPTGHFWHFLAEVPVGSRKSKDSGAFAVWLQRWSLPFLQTPTQGHDSNARFGAPST